MKIQSIPNPDSPNNDAFEAVVELYYQTLGYLTSSGKWFWVWENGKKQRGYQDIDVLAVNEKDVVIISVTSNLDDKLRKGRDGKINDAMLQKLSTYFSRTKQYLESVPQYKWLTGKDRKIRKVVAYNHAFKNANNEVIPVLKESGIEVISAKNILATLSEYVKQPNIKIQDQMLRTIQLLEYNGKIEI
ncbi:hypothetical protein [Hydrogenimonas sp.]